MTEPMKPSVTLLPCPFCGGMNIDPTGWQSIDAKGPACDDCGASAGQISLDHADNIAAWNRRPPASDSTGAGIDEKRRRTLTDTQRLLWRDDVEGICASPDMCFEYGTTVRCGPCAIKQSNALGVTADLSLPNLPEVSRLRRELAAARSPDSLGMLRERLEVASGDLHMLRLAVSAGDPKAELLHRIHDAKREVDAALALSQGEAGK